MYNIFDAHCDTAYEIFKDGAKGNFRENILHFSLKNTIEYNKYVQILAHWADPAHSEGADSVAFMKEFISETKNRLNGQEIEIILSGDQFDFATGFRALLSIEGGRALYNDINDLYYYYEQGVRCLTLTWNGSCCLACGWDVENGGGLTEFGKEVVREMNKLNMIVDVSHINEKGFYDVLETTDKPVIASHSDSLSICSHKRNLSDEQFKALIENGGVAGINLCCDFLENGGNASTDSIVKHIDKFMELGGENNIGIGSDFDGIPKLPLGISGNADLYKICDALAARGYTGDQIDKISYGNFERIFRII